MSYQINFDGLKKDIFTLVAWILSFSGASHIDKYNGLKNKIKTFNRMQTAELLLSVSARLRIIRDSTKNIYSDSLKEDCGELWNIDDIGFNLNKTITSISLSQNEKPDLLFTNALDKILHATIDFRSEKHLDINTNKSDFIIILSGSGKSKEPKWRAHMNPLSFCELALQFIEDKEKHYNEMLLKNPLLN